MSELQWHHKIKPQHLSRTDKDWCHLLEVCRVFDTLLGDAEQVYDLSHSDDQLVLGIKGTMSVIELNTILSMQEPTCTAAAPSRRC